MTDDRFEKKPCPVCGKLIANIGVVMHNKSKFHLDALAAQQGTKLVVNEPEVKKTLNPIVTKEVEKPVVIPAEPKTQKLNIQPKPVATIAAPEVKHDTAKDTTEWKGFFPDDE